VPVSLRYLLIQARDPDDAIRGQEIACFARALGCETGAIRPFDMLSGAPLKPALKETDLVLIGGSGRYGATGSDYWLMQALDGLRELVGMGKPTFASCWGFQALSRALGGTVIKDLDHAELGTLPVTLTTEGAADPVFGDLAPSFCAVMGHEDRVVVLPAGAVLLASTERTQNQAFRFEGRPIYCTQFHSELDTPTFLSRVAAYPEYADRIHGLKPHQLAASCQNTEAAATLLPRFIRHVFGNNTVA